MRKSTVGKRKNKAKVKTVLFLSMMFLAVSALSAGNFSMAASGWQEEDGVWIWYDNNGEYVTETWKKSGAQYFYLDKNGEMATDRLIENGDGKYYVDENGVRVIEQWVMLPNNDDIDFWQDYSWYYFGSNGRAYTGKRTIEDQLYFFDEEGRMLTGWYEDESGSRSDFYYLGSGDQGWVHTGWQLLTPSEDMEPPKEEGYNEEEWFYFAPSGKAARDTDRRYINGAYYTFDVNGVMINKWMSATPSEAAPSDDDMYFQETGERGEGWIYVPDAGEDESSEKYWFYLNSKGKPFNRGGAGGGIAQEYSEGELTEDEPLWDAAMKEIESEKYLFDSAGRMQAGVYKMTKVPVSGAGGSADGIYYFNENEGSRYGQMMTGKQTVNYDGNNYYYHFQDNGKAYTCIIMDGVLYGKNGVRIQSEAGRAVYELPFNISVRVNGSLMKHPKGALVIINASGKVTKSSKKITIDGKDYVVENYRAYPFDEYPPKPEDLIVPEEPEEPDVPIRPTEPSKPEEPTEPSKPTEPTDPSKPTEPTDPSKPTEPAEPENPDGFEYDESKKKLTINSDAGFENWVEFVGSNWDYKFQLKELVIGKKVTEIPDEAFYNDYSELKRVTIKEGVTSIGDRCFMMNNKIESITLPSSIEVIGEYAFSSCVNLKEITINAIIPPTLGNDVFSPHHENLKIRVPGESIAAYMTDPHWDPYKDIIQQK